MELEAKEWLDGNELSYNIWDKKYRHNNESFSEWLERVSAGDETIKRLIKEKKFLFGGRTLANRGTDKQGSFSNCYSIGYVPDSLDDIMDVAHKIAMTFKAQGGQGLSLSKIRPKGSMIAGQYESDGIVPFMNIFNTVTESVSQGGSRKGALMMSIDAWHPEAETFIKIKEDLNKINKANLSVEIDNRFMKGVVDGNEYTDRVFRTICESAWKSAEPGILFVDRLRNYNLMECVDDYNIETTNPCGEQPLPKHGACNLCSINISEYVENQYTDKAYFDFRKFTEDIFNIVKAMDDVLEENAERHALEEQKEMALKYRNIGIGIMGLADCLVKLGYRYGDSDSLCFAESLMVTLFREAVYSSVKLAKERGSFPGYDSKVWDSDIIHIAFEDKEIEELKENNCLRNCSLISIAPTGSIGTMLNVSTGVEPFFALSYNRKTESLDGKTYKVNIKAIDDYYKINPSGTLSDTFVTSNDIHYKERIKMQAALQKYCDTAISSTVNLPESATVEDIKDLYKYAWKVGLKGVTVYRQGSREAILSVDDKPVTIGTTSAPKRPKELNADCYAIKVKGQRFIVVVGLLDNRPYEIFAFQIADYFSIKEHKGVITKVKKGQYSYKSEFLDIDNLISKMEPEEQAVTLYCSMLLRHGVNIGYIRKTTKKVNNLITSFSSALCRILSKYIPKTENGVCPECGSPLIHEGGCTHCSNLECTYSKCE